MILSGSAHPTLARQLAKLTNQKLGQVEISKFPNGEKRIWVKEKLKNKTVVIVQPFSEPVDEHIIEFFLLCDAAYHLEAKLIIGVVPWFGYSPQDKLFRQGEPISAQVMARLIEAVRLSRIIIADIHSHNTLSYFRIPVTHISALDIFIDYFKGKLLKNHAVVALDQGAFKASSQLATTLNLPLIRLEKRRHRKTGTVDFKALHGDVKNKHLISFDDFVSTGSTRIQASRLLLGKGALSYTDCITHALLTKDTPKKLQQSTISQLLTTDSYPIPKAKRFPKLTIIPIAPLIAKALKPLLK